MEEKTNGISIPGDLIRAVAIIFVIIMHATAEPNPNLTLTSLAGAEYWWSTNIYAAMTRTTVPLFLMLTGILLLHPTKADEPWQIFLKKRWLRIGLPFLFWGITYLIWDLTVVHHINNQAITTSNIIQGMLNQGPAYQFWYIYLLIGLYLLTPLLRVFTKSASKKALKYLAILWFTGVSIVPLISAFTPFSLDGNLFFINCWVGYFLLGLYLMQVRIKRPLLLLIYALASITTIVGAYMFTDIGNTLSYFIQPYSFNLIIAAMSLFMLLSSIPDKTIKTNYPHLERVIKVIGQNSLPLFFLHVIILTALQVGNFGFKISLTTINPILEIPLISVVTLLICLAIILPLKRIPYIKRLIG